MRCLSCHYDLRNLAERRCPECGSAFDPDDPALKHPRRTYWLRLLREAGFAVLGLAAAMVIILLYPITCIFENQDDD